MRQNPIALIEFVAFIGLVFWLFTWQNKSTKPGRTRGGQTDAASTAARAERPERSAADDVDGDR